MNRKRRSHDLCALMAHLVAPAARQQILPFVTSSVPYSPAGDIFILVSEIGNFRVLSGEIKITHEDSASPVSAVPCSLDYPSVNASFCLYAGVGFSGWVANEGQSWKVLLSILGKLHMAEKRRGVRQLWRCLVTLLPLPKPVVHLRPHTSKSFARMALPTRVPLPFQRFLSDMKIAHSWLQV